MVLDTITQTFNYADMDMATGRIFANQNAPASE